MGFWARKARFAPGLRPPTKTHCASPKPVYQLCLRVRGTKCPQTDSGRPADLVGETFGSKEVTLGLTGGTIIKINTQERELITTGQGSCAAGS